MHNMPILLFKTTSMEIIQLCQTYLCFELPSVLLKNRTEKFRKKYTEYHYTRYDIDLMFVRQFRLKRHFSYNRRLNV